MDSQRLQVGPPPALVGPREVVGRPGEVVGGRGVHQDGLVHISQIANERVENVSDHLEEGQEVTVKVLDVDQRGRIKLSIKELLEDEAADAPAEEVEAAE